VTATGSQSRGGSDDPVSGAFDQRASPSTSGCAAARKSVADKAMPCACALLTVSAIKAEPSSIAASRAANAASAIIRAAKSCNAVPPMGGCGTPLGSGNVQLGSIRPPFHFQINLVVGDR
jgi:hypothetical protein